MPSEGESLGKTASATHSIESKIGTSPLNIAFWGHDSNESTIRKRVKAIEAAGCKVTGFMFSRLRSKPVPAPTWENVELGVTKDGNYVQRVGGLFRALIVIWHQRELLRSADLFYARNIDMLFMARVAKAMVRSKAPLVYEALDVHPAMTRRTGIGPILRFVERRLLRASSLLVVSSPMFIERYFVPIQGYAGSWFLLENKVVLGTQSAEARVRQDKSTVSPPWTIGWFGVIRCRRSLDMLQRIAAAMPERIIIHIRGTPSEPDGITKELLEKVSSISKNISYFGPYRSPDDLAAMYGAVDLTWAVDFSAAGANSDWLIPNRLYEGGLYGTPAIARRLTATGNIVETDGRGWSFDEPFEENVSAFLSKLSDDQYKEVRERLLKKERSAFVDITDTPRLVSRLQEIAKGSPVRAQR